MNNVSRSPVVNSDLASSRSTYQASLLEQPSNQPSNQSIHHQFESDPSPESQRPLEKHLENSSLTTSSRDSPRSDPSEDRLDGSETHSAVFPQYPSILQPNSAFLCQDLDESLMRAPSGYNPSSKPIDWSQIHSAIFPYYPWVWGPNAIRQEDSTPKVNVSPYISCKASRIKSTKTEMSPPKKRSISKALHLMDHSPPPRKRRSMPQAEYGSLQARMPPMVTWQTTPAHPQHQSQHSTGSDYQLHSTPGPTPSGSKQGAPSASSRNLVKDTQPIDPSKANHRSAYDSPALTRHVLHAARKNPGNGGLKEDLKCLKSHLPQVNDSLGLSKLNLSNLLRDIRGNQSPQLVRKTKMPPIHRLADGLFDRVPVHKPLEHASRQAPPTPSNLGSDDTTLVNRLPDLLTEGSSALDTSMDLAWGPARIREVPQQVAAVAAQQSSFQNASTSASGARSISVIISSPLRLPGPKPLVFGLAESDKELSPKGTKKATPRREQPKRTAASKVFNTPTLGPRENGASSRQKKAIPPTESETKRGRQNKGPAAVTKDKATKKKSKLYALPKDFSTDIPIPKAKYNVYFCEWEGCPAELHNLETLRNHVLRVHNKKLPSGARLCLWGKCCQNHDAADNEEKSREQLDRAEFRTKAEWEDHINQAHILPVAWQLGDGPMVTIPGRFFPTHYSYPYS